MMQKTERTHTHIATYYEKREGNHDYYFVYGPKKMPENASDIPPLECSISHGEYSVAARGQKISERRIPRRWANEIAEIARNRQWLQYHHQGYVSISHDPNSEDPTGVTAFYSPKGMDPELDVKRLGSYLGIIVKKHLEKIGFAHFITGGTGSESRKAQIKRGGLPKCERVPIRDWQKGLARSMKSKKAQSKQ